jgi:hypothetical protein
VELLKKEVKYFSREVSMFSDESREGYGKGWEGFMTEKGKGKRTLKCCLGNEYGTWGK